MELPVRAQKQVSPSQGDYEGTCEKSSPTKKDLVGQFTALDAECVVALDTGAAASPVCCKCLGRLNSILDRCGVPLPRTYPVDAGFQFVDGRLGIAGGRGEFTALALAADIPGLLRRGELGALGG